LLLINKIGLNNPMVAGHVSARLSILILMILLVLTPHFALASNAGTNSPLISFSTLFHNIDSNFIGSFTHNYGINHLIAASATYGLVESDIDWRLRTYLKSHKDIPYSGFPSVMVGGLTPLVVPISLYYYGKSRNRDDLRITALALGQAAILGLTVSSAYKTITGRRPPDILDSDNNDNDFSDDFRFGFMKRGIFDGWPSGHATTAFAMATTLIELYPDNQYIKAGAIIYASLVGAGVSTNIHWVSDAVAGALIGYSIGKSVGKSFKGLDGEPNNKIKFGFTFSRQMGTFMIRF